LQLSHSDTYGNTDISFSIEYRLELLTLFIQAMQFLGASEGSCHGGA